MGILLLILTVLTGGLAGNRLAKWRGLNVGLLTYGSVLLGAIVIPAGFLMRGHPERSTGTKAGALAMIALWLACLLSLWALGARNVMEDDHRATINRIIADNYQGATVEADYVSLPMMGLAPMLSSQYSGYFTIKSRPGMPPLPDNCKLITVDFTARDTGDNYILTIAPNATYWPNCGG